MKIGDHVWLIVGKAKKKAFIDGKSENGFWVKYYGPPNHFSRIKNRYGIYRGEAKIESLRLREPDFTDPLEF